MTVRSPAGPLIHEHHLIKRVVALLQAQLGSLEQEGRVDPAVIEGAADFILNYADPSHHGKEEQIWFARLETKDPDAQISQMMHELIEEHVQARDFSRQLMEASRRYATGDRQRLQQIEAAARGLVELYPQHTQKEERVFFRQSLEYFSEDERADMIRAYDEFDRALYHERYKAFLEELEETSKKSELAGASAGS